MAEMTVEQQQALALASARLRAQQSDQTQAQEDTPIKSQSLGLKKNFESKPTRSGEIVSNTAMEAVAGFPDMFINAPSNLTNLGRAAVGTAQINHGVDPTVSISEAPNLVRNYFQKQGWINPNIQPTTEGEKILSAGAGGAASGVTGGIPGMLIGGISGIAGQQIEKMTGSPVAGLAASLLTPYAANKVGQVGNRAVALAEELKRQKAPLIDTTVEVRNAGYVMPPSMTNPTLLNKMLEGMGGKVAMQQDASIRNQGVTDAVVRRGIGAPSDMPITEQSLAGLRDTKAQPYNDMTSLAGLPSPVVGTQLAAGGHGPIVPMYGKTPATPEQLVHDWKSTNAKANLTWKEYDKNKKVESLDRYNALKDQAAQIERDLEAAAVAANRPEMLLALKKARVEIAKVHDVERALNPDRGEVSALDMARAKNNGVKFTGELDTAASMGNAFPKAIQRPETVGSPGVNNLNSMIGAGIGGTLGGLSSGGIGGGIGAVAGAAATPYIQSLVRQLLLSKPYQKTMGDPNYDANLVMQGLSKLPQTSTAEALTRAYLAQQLQGQQQ